jgi:hydroxymethylglutaryl-CoA reductase
MLLIVYLFSWLQKVYRVKTSRIEGMYRLPPAERLKAVAELGGVSEEDLLQISHAGLSLDQADKMVENVIGLFQVPLGVATNFIVDKREVLIPMATEEPSVIAAASNGARMARGSGGFFTSSTDPVMRAQIQVTEIEDPYAAKHVILEHAGEISKLADDQDPMLVKYGGGVVGIEVDLIETIFGQMVVAHLLVDCRDAMGANAVNTMAEAVAPFVEKITGGRVYLRIISNLADRRLARARAVFKAEDIGGPEVVEGILKASALAESDPYRAATHNKGIMNGVTAVVLATGNDTRAVEAGAHAYAARGGRYKSLSHFEKNINGDLVGTIELPLAVGLVGGATRVHPVARAVIKILGVETADALGRIIASVGLAQNFAALRALSTEGIQRGHMSLHARNLAVQAGAAGELVDEISARMVSEGKVSLNRAIELLKEMG